MDRSLDPMHLDVKLPKPMKPEESGGAWDLTRDPVESFAWMRNAFTDDELDAIIRIGQSIELQKGSTYGGDDSRLRDSYVSFIFPNDVTAWVFERLANVINSINGQFFKFDLHTMGQGLQFTRYQAPGEHYSWHVDKGYNTPIRKLSLSLQLSDPNDYEGGDLELWYGGEPQKMCRDRGLITLFPSYVVHRVTPVTSGVRYSLVCWVSGPPFK